MASKTLLFLFGISFLLLAIQLQIDALRFLPQQQIQEAQERMRDAAMKESFVQQYLQSQNLPVGKAMNNKPNMIMPEEVGLEALDANKKAGLACGEDKPKKSCGDKKNKPKKKPGCGGDDKDEKGITD